MHQRLRRGLSAVALGLTAAVALAACSSGSSGGGSSDDVASALAKGGTLTYWSWTPSAKAQVAAFEKAYPKVTVKLVNAGTGNDQYTKLQNTIKAGSGAPDVAQVEYFAVPQFALSDSLLDLSSYGLGDLKSKYSESTWKAVDLDGKLYGLPQDSGPMAMFYNKRIFDQYGLSVPKTWDEYVAAAKKLHEANPDEYITADTGDAGFTTSMIAQAGGKPFTTNGTKVSINLADDAGTKKWTSTWNTLVENKLLAQTTGWTDDWFKQLGNGQIATLLTGAWMPGNLEASAPEAKGDWRVAPMPTYDGGAAVTANNGGSSEVVMKQSKNPALAAGFLKWLNSSKESTSIFAKSGGFPSTTADLASSSFVNDEPEYFGGQQINKVLVDASKSAKSFTYLPYQVYGNSVYADTAGQAYQNSTALSSGLDAWQTALAKYGKEQGFTVSTK